MKAHKVRTYKSIEGLPREEQLAWKIAAAACDPVPIESDVVEMIGNRISDNAAVAAASLARAPAAAARAPAVAHVLQPGATVLGLPRHHRVSPEWAAWAHGVAARHLELRGTFRPAHRARP